MVNSFDPEKAKDAIARFGEYVRSKVSTPAPSSSASEGAELLRAASSLIAELKKVLDVPSGELHFRRITEMEAHRKVHLPRSWCTSRTSNHFGLMVVIGDGLPIIAMRITISL